MHSMWVSCVCVGGGGGGCCALDNHPDWGEVLAEGVIFEAADDDADHEAQMADSHRKGGLGRGKGAKGLPA